MCGIVGWFSRRGEFAPRLLAQAATALRHRGPDDEGAVLIGNDGSVSRMRSADTVAEYASLPRVEEAEGGGFLGGIAHRRLSVIAPSAVGHQPMISVRSGLVLAFNGEIYNYIELAEALRRQGVQVRAVSDTEVALACLDHWGTDALERFEGMWAIALWHPQTEKCLLSRDPSGIKPLYVFHGDRHFAFASEPKALLRLPTVTRSVNAERAFRFLRWGESDFGAGTMFQDISQVEQGATFEFAPRSWQLRSTRRREDTPTRLATSEVSYSAAVELVRDEFLRQLSLHRRSDVPIGTALSGGVDSSAIVSGLKAISTGLNRLDAFTYDAGVGARSESAHAAVVAQRTGVTLHWVKATAEDAHESLLETLRSHDEPFGSSRILAQRLVYKAAASAGIKVMLNGQGADELLGGYYYFLGPLLRDLLRQARWRDAFRLTRISAHLDGWSSYQTLALAGSASGGAISSTGLRVLAGRRLIPNWLRAEWFERRGVRVREIAVAMQGAGKSLDCRLRDAQHTSSLPHLLRYEDRNAMAFSVENRVPFLGQRFVRIVNTLPEDYLITSAGTTKHVFRDAMSGIVPRRILERRDKIGFETPERAWVSQWLSKGDVNVDDPESPLRWSTLSASPELRRENDHSLFRAYCFNLWTREYGISF